MPPTLPLAAATAAPRILVAAGVLAAVGFFVVLGMQRILSADLGYHLAYGDAFWNEGRLVDSNNDILYTLDHWPKSDTGPGCWYDSQGRYRFPNANWLTQVAMSGAYRLGGRSGLCALKALLAAALGLLSLKTLRNFGVSWVASAGAIVLLGLVCYPRLLLRPELFSFVLLTGQLAILTRHTAADPAHRWRLSRKAVAGLIVLQCLLANVHSYFLLGLALTGAVLVDRALYLWWQRAAGQGDGEVRQVLRRSTIRLAILLAAQAAVCFVNPWTWRIVALPFQTLWFLHQQQAAEAAGQAAPWLAIKEFLAPFSEGAMPYAKAKAAYFVLLALAGVGSVAALARRRWADALLIAGTLAVSFRMQRNIPFAALVAVPAALGAIGPFASWLGGRLRPGMRRSGAIAAGLLVGLAASGLIAFVVSQKFFSTERLAARFGWGFDELGLGLGPAEWLNEHQPQGRLWADYNISSNLHYFTAPHRRVPIVTNTWAFPPTLLQAVLEVGQGKAPLNRFVERFSPEIIVASVEASRRFIFCLAADPEWVAVCVDSTFVVFLRASGPNAELARRLALRDDRFDARQAIRRIERLCPEPAEQLRQTGIALQDVGLRESAMALIERCLVWAPRHALAWNALGTCYANRAGAERFVNAPAAKADFEKAGECFRKALEIDPAYGSALQNFQRWRLDARNYPASPPR